MFSVMEKLPATSYVRLVDIWLIFGQLIPFVEVDKIKTFLMIQIQIFTKVALFTTVERYNDDQFINHHGFQRNVKDKDTKLNLKDLNNGLNGIPKVRMAQIIII